MNEPPLEESSFLGDECQGSQMGGRLGGDEDHLLGSALHGVVGRERGDRKPGRPAPEDQLGRCGGGGRRQPFPSGAPAAPPLERVTPEHSTVATSSRGAGRLSGKPRAGAGGPGSSTQRQHQHQHQHRPCARALRPAACVLAREPALPSSPCAAEYGAAVLRGHPARAPGRAGPAAAGGPACAAELAPPGGALRAPRLLLPVRAAGDQAAHAEDAGLLDAGGTARTGLPSPAVPAPSAPDIPGPPCWDILVSATICKMLRWPRPPGLAFHSAP